MKAKLYLVSALIASAGTAFAASQKPQYNEMTLPGGVSTAYFRGSLVYADVNGDGNMDLIVKGRDLNNGWNPDVVLITTDNSGNLDSSVKLPASMPYESTLSAFDFNNDGMIDIIYSGETSNESKAVVAINEGGLAFTQYDDLLCKARGGVAVAAYDINKNGFPNIAIMGYNNDGAPHMHVYNGLCSRNVNEAPTAPANLAMKADGGKVTLTWDAAADSKTPAEALRYNVYVKLTDGSLVTVIPANPATGTLRLGDVNAALTSRSYTLNISADKIAEWGVQAIDGGKMAGPFAKYDPTSGIDTVTEGAAGISIMCSGSDITVSADATLTVADMAGNVLLGTKVAAGQAVQTGLKAGAYIVRAEGKDGAAVVRKFIIR